MAITKQDRSNLRSIIAKMAQEAAPKLQAQLTKLAEENPNALVPENIHQIIIGENAIMRMIETVFAEFYPPHPLVVAEIGVRITARMISALPVEKRVEVAVSIAQGVPDYMMRLHERGDEMRPEFADASGLIIPT